MAARLEPPQVQRITVHFEQFREFLKTDTAKTWDKERTDRTLLYRRLLAKYSIDKLGEVELGEDFRKSLAFIEAKEILKAASLLHEFNLILNKLELVKPQF